MERQVSRHRARLLAGEAAAVSARAAAARLPATSSTAKGRRSWASVNFVTAHDGFTLNDWASYNDKHNEANGEDNKDGNSNNHSWNCGVEGPTDDKDILALRERQKRNMLATLLLSQGTPMLLGGDEFGRTQQGNNNAYCQDNDISWFDWNFGESAQKLLGFHQARDPAAARLSDPAPQPLPHRRARRAARHPRRHLDQCRPVAR